MCNSAPNNYDMIYMSVCRCCLPFVYLELLVYIIIIWREVTHVFSLEDRHESNGAERVIQEVVRYISAMVHKARAVTDYTTIFG